ncbi:hypothetical protein E2558_01065 [Staphylococcus pragensis]|uniref:Uncharacterized protein n=1 Tax=Staphylococcus pragensis TaxID=1611836 RepID=A0A4Z1BKT6_9STAP|nr:hypothetical protein [Staphylococcus pragensis]RTX90674.1 hypothetical protein CD154_03690 [Staphylococcus carnosus]TGN28247.1 hypothetical protein E2558_01065 [Staphylococcus pragensis]GGG88973.1 hypothetical protein GCM10007342_09160 [Staphylococcus pragensis]
MNCFIRLKNNDYVEIKELKEIKFSYPHSQRVTNIKVDNIQELKISFEANYVFIGKSTVVIKGDEIQYVQLFES